MIELAYALAGGTGCTVAGAVGSVAWRRLVVSIRVARRRRSSAYTDKLQADVDRPLLELIQRAENQAVIDVEAPLKVRDRIVVLSSSRVPVGSRGTVVGQDPDDGKLGISLDDYPGQTWAADRIDLAREPARAGRPGPGSPEASSRVPGAGL